MRERKKVFDNRKVTVRLFTIKDKAKSMFRARYPDEHHVELMIGNCIVRDWLFDEAAHATDHYDNLMGLL
jgi:hypothetical protein